ncbi:hypothetical protein GBA52_024609 [Prunus armeniaca]|nr:hypothetical protein GBA52_024609 [Prunus armeniaca]
MAVVSAHEEMLGSQPSSQNITGKEVQSHLGYKHVWPVKLNSRRRRGENEIVSRGGADMWVGFVWLQWWLGGEVVGDGSKM